MHIDHHYSLHPHNTLALSQQARAFARVNSNQTLHALLDWARAQGLALQVLGHGSNVILSQDIDALVLHPTFDEFTLVHENDDEVIVRLGAGLHWDDCVARCLAQGWYGLENLSLIPGSVGASPVQNIGAYGVEVADCTHAVLAYELQSAKALRLTQAECHFTYRDSLFKSERPNELLIYAVEFRLSKHFTPKLEYPALAQALAQEPVLSAATVRSQVCAIRRHKLPDPQTLPNAGSFFKNPLISQHQYQQLRAIYPTIPAYPQPRDQVKLAAGWLIEQCGWKGKRLANTGMHSEQALVMVNYGNASGDEVLQLAKAIQHDVQQGFHVTLEIEPVVL